ncbi:SMI1/KNR4 family protein [Metabacillus idriensis]|uniref:SMI1/KNR4 family protein n=1 Tax=Metabacillus idriensis TaxID=324768 RepID=UPI001CD5C17B|nr:SMI1/KNR4 family protein [Metabacillus idriensis]
MEKVDYLKKYNKKIQIIDLENTINTNYDNIPSLWVDVFMEKDFKRQVELLLENWTKHLGSELSNTIAYLRSNLIDLDLLENEGAYSILYSVKNSEGRILYYEGKNPNNHFHNKSLINNWDKISTSIRTFYEKIHDGFYYYASESMGLVSLNSVTYLDEYEWGILDEIDDPIKINLQTSYGFFSNGMGGYVVFDFENGQNDNATLWWNDEYPDYNIN